jgi:hypothetical protein
MPIEPTIAMPKTTSVSLRGRVITGSAPVALGPA